MPVKLPTSGTEPVSTSAVENRAAITSPPGEKTPENKFDPFHPEMPTIPGVSKVSHPAVRAAQGPDLQRLIRIGGGIAAVALLSALIFWWAKSKPRGAAGPAADAEATDQPVPSLPVPALRAPVHDGPVAAATVEELSKPWAAKKFNFVKPITHENIDALVIRLPSGGLWGFALKGPADRCELEFVADLDVLATTYGFNAAHPMVVSPCDRTVYDPLKVGALGGNTWVRGEIVQGNGLRPPISIDVKVQGREIVADNIE
jgi:hypothetical protein